MSELVTLYTCYVHSNLKLLQKLQSLDYQEANVECKGTLGSVRF